jgi:exoribonuclease R
MVPYELKLGFSKDIKNKYIVFTCEHCNDKHPRGSITHTIGDVNDTSAYYEYRLYCLNVHDSISEFTQKVRELTKDPERIYASIISNPKFRIESRLDVPVYSIDPEGCTDIDDAFSIQPLMGEQGYKISIYIANVYVWIETLGLWDYINNRVSTIYLPDKRRTMLPAILSENLCSLVKHKPRIAFCMDVWVDMNGGVIREPEFKNVEISLHSNFAYDDPRVMSNPNCILFAGAAACGDFAPRTPPSAGTSPPASNNDLTSPPIHPTSPISNPVAETSPPISSPKAGGVRGAAAPANVIERWMIYMNTICGDILAHKKNGIFRTATIAENSTNKMRHIIRKWNDVNCVYTTYSDDVDMSHQLLQVDAYTHITSPIRRLVDLLNQTIFIHEMGMADVSTDAIQFVENWKQKIEYINVKMKSIRKTQTECELMLVPMDCEYNGIVFGKTLLDNNMFQYSMYVENLKIFGKVKTPLDLPEYSSAIFRLYYFGDEYNRKLKFQIIESMIKKV